MNVGLPSETIKNAAIRIKELERENAELREQVDAYVASGVSWNGEWVNTKANKLERENAELRAVAMKLIVNNGGPLQLEEQAERDSADDYVMIKLQDFEALCAAIDAAKKEAGDDVIMRQHLSEGGTPT